MTSRTGRQRHEPRTDAAQRVGASAKPPVRHVSALLVRVGFPSASFLPSSHTPFARAALGSFPPPHTEAAAFDSAAQRRILFAELPPLETFARGDADALIGYSERLHPILEGGGGTQGNLYVASATLGMGDQPMLFTDALVLSQNCSTERCRDAASAFAAYYVSDAVFEVVLMSLDVGDSAVPRYLLPSTTSAFGFGKVSTDSFYRQLRREVDGAVSTPNRGLPEARDAGVIRAKVKQALGLE